MILCGGEEAGAEDGAHGPVAEKEAVLGLVLVQAGLGVGGELVSEDVEVRGGRVRHGFRPVARFPYDTIHTMKCNSQLTRRLRSHPGTAMYPFRRTLLVGFCVLGTLLTLAAGCSSKIATGPKGSGNAANRVAFISNNAFDFWLIARAGTEKAAKEFGVQVDFRMPAQGTAVEQRQIIEDLMTSGVRYYAVSVNDAMNQGEFYNDLITKQGAVVITQDTDLPPGSKRLCYIGTDNFKAGLAAGELVKKGQPNGGKVAIFVGSIDKLNAIERRNGVVAALAGLKTNDEANQLVAKGYPITAGNTVSSLPSPTTATSPSARPTPRT